MNHPPFLWSPGGSGLGCSLSRDRFVQPWIKPKLGGVVATGEPLTWSSPSSFCSAAPNPSWCASHIYGLPPTSRYGKAAFLASPVIYQLPVRLLPWVIGSSDIFGLNFIVCIRKSQQTELSAMSSIAFDFLLQPFGICFVHALRKPLFWLGLCLRC